MGLCLKEKLHINESTAQFPKCNTAFSSTLQFWFSLLYTYSISSRSVLLMYHFFGLFIKAHIMIWKIGIFHVFDFSCVDSKIEILLIMDVIQQALQCSEAWYSQNIIICKQEQLKDSVYVCVCVYRQIDRQIQIHRYMKYPLFGFCSVPSQ